MKNTDRKKLIQRYYSLRAKDYDRQKSRTWRSSQGFGVDVINELLNALVGFENKLLLEVGVGSGRNALPLLEKMKSRFIGLDLSREMLGLARTKMSLLRQSFDLVLGDAEHLPFVDDVFDAIVCMSTMHYFTSQAKILKMLSTRLRKRGRLVYGDLTIHELDSQRYFEKLERTLSKAHAKYYRPLEIERLLETRGFRVLRARTIPYRKSYRSLMEDKGQYFDVLPEALDKCLEGASSDAREEYALTDTELTLFYTIVIASRNK
jgi:ubiquinone/menaquinone biosynthesis C-methylase UbiE